MDQNKLTIRSWLHGEVTDDRVQDYLGFGPPFEDFRMVYRPKDGDYQNLQRFPRSLVRFADKVDEEADNEHNLCLFLALPQGTLVLLRWLKGSMHQILADRDG